MAIDNSTLEGWEPRVLALLRIVTGFLLIPHETAKLFGMPHQAMFLVGLFTRPVAFALCGFMAAAYLMGHAIQGSALLPMLNQGELAVLYRFVFLYFVFWGAGAWSLDSVRAGRPAAHPACSQS